MARIRATPEDFQVEEVPLYPPAGRGDHTFVRVEKRLRTTEEVARALAKAAGVSARDVGYAGRKDRRALAIQWLSVPGLDPERALDLTLPGVRVLEARPHGHKLRTGQLRANRFRIVVRDVDADACREAERRLSQLLREGMPNRYGAQRFGRDGRGAELGARLLRGEAKLRDRREARFAISALQSAVFNDVLASRPRPLCRLEAGDVAIVHASGGPFLVEDPQREQPRANAFEISPSGPIFGTRALLPAGEVARREAEAMRRRGVDPADLTPPRGVRLRGARRPLCVQPANVSILPADGAFQVSFELPAGSYATVLVEELLGGPPEDGPGGDTESGAGLS